MRRLREEEQDIRVQIVWWSRQVFETTSERVSDPDLLRGDDSVQTTEPPLWSVQQRSAEGS